MSERGSFVTEYMCCSDCFKVLKKHLLKEKCKFMYANIIKADEDSGDFLKDRDYEFPIIAGKIGGSHSGQEMIDFMENYGDDIEKEICHPVDIAILSDSETQRGIVCLYPLSWTGERKKSFNDY